MSQTQFIPAKWSRRVMSFLVDLFFSAEIASGASGRVPRSECGCLIWLVRMGAGIRV